MTPKRDNSTVTAPMIAIPPATYSADFTSDALDMLGFGAATLLLTIGVGGIVFTEVNKIEFLLTHSVNQNDSYEPVPGKFLVGMDGFIAAAALPGMDTGKVRLLTAAHAAPTVQKLGYTGGRRWLKLMADFSGAHGTGTPIAATISRRRPGVTGG